MLEPTQQPERRFTGTVVLAILTLEKTWVVFYKHLYTQFSPLLAYDELATEGL